MALGRSTQLRWTALHLASLGGILGFVGYVARGQWFFGDEWDFLVFRGIRGAHKLGLWTPHNEHWSTIPILLWRATFHFVGIGSYWPYMALMFIAHLACVHFLWRILRRLPNVSEPMAIAGAVLLGLFGAGWENLLWAFQIGFVGSLAFGLGLVAAIDRTGGGRRVLGVAFGAVLSLMMSGISVVMVGVVGLTALTKWGWRKALLATAPAGAVYLAWFERYAKPSLQQQQQLHGTIGDIPRFVVGGVGGTLGAAISHQDWGSYLLILLAVVAVWNARRWFRDAPEALAMAIGSVTMYVVISQGRGALPQPATSRYLYLSGGLLIPIVVLAVAQVARRAVWSRAIAVAAVALLAVNGALILRDQSREQRRIDLADKGQFIAAEQLAAKGIHLVSDQPQSPFNPDVKIADVNSLRRRGKSFDYPVNERDRAGAQLALQVGSTEAEVVDRPLGNITAPIVPAFSLRPLPDGCVRLRPNGAGVELDMTGRSAFTIRATQSATIELYLQFPSGFAGPRYVGVKPGVRTTIVSDVTGKIIMQRMPVASEICGLTWR